VYYDTRYTTWQDKTAIARKSSIVRESSGCVPPAEQNTHEARRQRVHGSAAAFAKGRLWIDTGKRFQRAPVL
jgi:hypothetical protein